MKYALITGSTGTIGSAICEILAKNKISLILAGRNKEKLKALQQKLKTKFKTNDYLILLADLRSKKSILKGIEEIIYKNNLKIQILINNASEVPKVKTITEEGLECQFAVNILGYHRMTHYLLDFFEEKARVINVASYWAGDLDIDDLQFNKRVYHNNTAYRQSKQAERMLSYKWSETLKDRKILVNACHPGDANSKLSNELGFGGHETPYQAALTPIYLATSEEVENITGKYFENQKAVPDIFIQDREEVNRIYELCNQYL